MGMARAALFLRDLDDYGRTWSNSLKVVLVGLGGAGKTSIATRLENRQGSRCPTPDERTVGVEIRDIKLGPGPARKGIRSNVELDVSLWDFAGQRAYCDTHQVGRLDTANPDIGAEVSKAAFFTLREKKVCWFSCL